MSHSSPAAAIPSTPSDISISQVISEELSAVRKNRKEVMTDLIYPPVHMGIILLCIGINMIYFLYRPDYMALFIAASFYVNMFYFIIILVVQNIPKKARTPKADHASFLSLLKEIGLKSSAGRFTKLFLNTFFINNRTLSLGICLIFTIDILFAIRAYTTLGLPLRTTIIVISQCTFIIAYYVLSWKAKPQSTKYVKRTVLFYAGFLISVVLFLTTIILLPGITLKLFLSGSRLAELGDLLWLTAGLAISQYFIIRYLQGFASRKMAGRLFDCKENVLRELQDKVRIVDNSLENRSEITSRLLETTIYKIQRNTLTGFFPVFMADLDFSGILDSTTRTAIKRYVGDTKPPEWHQDPVHT